MNQYTKPLIDFDEGDKSMPYQDIKGIWTFGIGHNAEANGLPPGVCEDALEGMPFPQCIDFIRHRGGLQEDEINTLFWIDVDANCHWLYLNPWWTALDEPRQAALEDMAFNLGPESMQQFTTFLGLIASGDYAAAATDLEFKTKVAKELPKRYGRLEKIIRTGSMDGILP